MPNIKAHLNNIAFSHMIFALPFAYMSAILAAGGLPPAHELFWITVAIFGARSAALALNNLADYRYDKLQPRLSYRALVGGKISMRAAKISVAVYFAIFVLAVLQLRPLCILLAPVAAIPFVVYPYTKRFTCLCHLVLGVAVAMAPAGAWVAVRGDVTADLVTLCAAVALWIGAFDAVYGAQDERFDLQHSLHSLATEFTAKGALIITKILHAASIALFVALGVSMQLSAAYFAGVGLAAFTLWYQHRIVKYNDFSRVTQEYFLRNGVVSVVMFFATLLSLRMM